MFFIQVEESVWNECTLAEDEERRKTTNREITTHVSIHTIHLDGLRELYRQFLRLPDGAVVEVSQSLKNVVSTLLSPFFYFL